MPSHLIYDFTWTRNWSWEQTSNSPWNSANHEKILLKWYDVHIEVGPWVMWGVLSGMHASRETKHHFKMTRGQGGLSWVQHLGNVEATWQLVHEDRPRIVKNTAAVIKVSYRTVQAILIHDLNIQRVVGQLVPSHLPKGESTVLQSFKSFVSMPWITHPSCRGSPLAMRVGS